MTTRQRVLFEMAQYLAIAAGVYFGTKGRWPWLAALVPLLMLGPFWLYYFVRARRARLTGARVEMPAPPNDEMR
jgi:hypothetical protein